MNFPPSIIVLATVVCMVGCKPASPTPIALRELADLKAELRELRNNYNLIADYIAATQKAAATRAATTALEDKQRENLFNYSNALADRLSDVDQRLREVEIAVTTGYTQHVKRYTNARPPYVQSYRRQDGTVVTGK